MADSTIDDERLAEKRRKAAEGMRRWRAANPEANEERKRRWVERNPEFAAQKKKEWQKRYYDTHKEKVAAYQKARYQADPAKVRAINLRWVARNPDKVKAASKRNRQKPGRAAIFNVRNAQRRARKKGAVGTYTKEDVQALFAAQAGKCAECRRKLPKTFHVDHILPLVLGGENRKRNLQLMCASCNCRKGHRHPIDFARAMGRLF